MKAYAPVDDLEMIARLVDVMRRCDPEFAAAHGVTETTDEEWDAAIEEAEDYLDDQLESEP